MQKNAKYKPPKITNKSPKATDAAPINYKTKINQILEAGYTYPQAVMYLTKHQGDVEAAIDELTLVDWNAPQEETPRSGYKDPFIGRACLQEVNCFSTCDQKACWKILNTKGYTARNLPDCLGRCFTCMANDLALATSKTEQFVEEYQKAVRVEPSARTQIQQRFVVLADKLAAKAEVNCDKCKPCMDCGSCNARLEIPRSARKLKEAMTKDRDIREAYEDEDFARLTALKAGKRFKRKPSRDNIYQQIKPKKKGPVKLEFIGGEEAKVHALKAIVVSQSVGPGRPPPP